MNFELIDCRPVPAGRTANAVREVKRRTGANLNSCDRTQEGVSFARSKGCTLQSQAELHWGWVNRLPGYNPANPPTKGTHLRLGDGVFGRVGQRLPRCQVGQDWGDAQAVLEAYHDLGIPAIRPYADPREKHHVNITLRLLPAKFDQIGALFRVLKRGSKGLIDGPRVLLMTKRLRAIPNVGTGDAYLATARGTFDAEVEAVVKDFQRDHGLKADGIVGKITWDAINKTLKW